MDGMHFTDSPNDEDQGFPGNFSAEKNPLLLEQLFQIAHFLLTLSCLFYYVVIALNNTKSYATDR